MLIADCSYSDNFRYILIIWEGLMYFSLLINQWVLFMMCLLMFDQFRRELVCWCCVMVVLFCLIDIVSFISFISSHSSFVFCFFAFIGFGPPWQIDNDKHTYAYTSCLSVDLSWTCIPWYKPWSDMMMLFINKWV